jgi:ribosomal-protein-alanine N-acetyltransferase
MKIIDASVELLDEIAAMEVRAFAVPWSKKTFEGAFGAETVSIFAAMEDDTLLGYACLLVIAPEGELMNIAVDDCYRGRGIGSALMEAVLGRAADRGAESVYLEVRDSNAPARHLYEKHGFEILGRRKKYYQKPVEDAILMKRTLGE